MDFSGSCVVVSKDSFDTDGHTHVKWQKNCLLMMPDH